MALLAWLQTLFTPQRQGKATPAAWKQSTSISASTPAQNNAAACELARRIVYDPDGAAALPADRSGQPFYEDAPDPMLLLGAVLRSRGDFEQAVRLREEILAQPETPPLLRARTLFELGRDYKQAGMLDRATEAYKDARKAGFPERTVIEDLCQLYADAGDFEKAAEMAEALGNPSAQACYMVRQAEDLAGGGNDQNAERLLFKALLLFPASPEARLALSRMFLLSKDPQKALDKTRGGLEDMGDAGRLILLEGLHAFAGGPLAPNIDTAAMRTFFTGLCDTFNTLKPNLVLCYYGGLFLRHIREETLAEHWFSKALALAPDFWAARLSLLSLTAAREELPPLLAEQIRFFIEAGARAKRFKCAACGLPRESIFSHCPRCRAWHSAAFRTTLA